MAMWTGYAGPGWPTESADINETLSAVSTFEEALLGQTFFRQ